MNRLLALLLLPILVVGNSFAHCCGSSAHSSHGDSRTHMHIGGHSHLACGHVSEGHDHSRHDHSRQNHHHAGNVLPGHGESLPLHVHASSDHDHDAIYLVVSDFAIEGTKNRTSVRYDQQTTAGETIGRLDDDFQTKLVVAHSQDAILSALPLYLLHAVLRL